MRAWPPGRLLVDAEAELGAPPIEPGEGSREFHAGEWLEGFGEGGSLGISSRGASFQRYCAQGKKKIKKGGMSKQVHGTSFFVGFDIH